MPAKKKTAKPVKSAKRASGATRKRPGGFKCDRCDFVAKHAMGLGRHRSARHGVVPKRITAAKPKATPPGSPWMTREDAADQAGVHYNTIRHWERRGFVRTMKKAGIRGIFVHGDDVRGAATGARPTGRGGRAVSIEELERRYTELVANLERLLAATQRGQSRLTKIRDAQPTAKVSARAKVKAKARPGRPGRPRSRR